MLLVKVPVPVPSVVLESEVVGLAEVLQQTPLAVTAAPPSEPIFPPDEAEVDVTEPGAVVVIDGRASVVNVISEP